MENTDSKIKKSRRFQGLKSTLTPSLLLGGAAWFSSFLLVVLPSFSSFGWGLTAQISDFRKIKTHFHLKRKKRKNGKKKKEKKGGKNGEERKKEEKRKTKFLREWKEGGGERREKGGGGGADMMFTAMSLSLLLHRCTEFGWQKTWERDSRHPRHPRALDNQQLLAVERSS